MGHARNKNSFFSCFSLSHSLSFFLAFSLPSLSFTLFLSPPPVDSGVSFHTHWSFLWVSWHLSYILIAPVPWDHHLWDQILNWCCWHWCCWSAGLTFVSRCISRLLSLLLPLTLPPPLIRGCLFIHVGLFYGSLLTFGSRCISIYVYYTCIYINLYVYIYM